MELLFVCIGGAFGSLTRYKLGQIIAQKSKTFFPINTFLINITGALFLGFLSSLKVSDNVYLLIGEGFLGAYTTFSTFMYEGFYLFQENDKLNAFIYILGSLIIGIIGFILGFELGNII